MNPPSEIRHTAAGGGQVSILELGTRAARAIERFGDRPGERDWHAPLAGHLIVVAGKPRR